MSKYEEVLKKYNCDLDDQEVADAVKKIIEEKVPENDTLEIKKFLMGSVELTSLSTTDSDESIMAFTQKVNDFTTAEKESQADSHAVAFHPDRGCCR